MSDSTEKLIVLRATPGRDATASEIARSRGEFRRQPHLTTTSIEVEVPAAARGWAARVGHCPTRGSAPSDELSRPVRLWRRSSAAKLVATKRV